MLDTGYWNIGILEYWIMDTGYRILDTGSWNTGYRYRMLDTRYWMPDTGYWILEYWNTGYWILDTRYWILDTGGPKRDRVGVTGPGRRSHPKRDTGWAHREPDLVLFTTFGATADFCADQPTPDLLLFTTFWADPGPRTHPARTDLLLFTTFWAVRVVCPGRSSRPGRTPLWWILCPIF